MEPLIYLHTVGPLYRGHIGTLVFTEVLVDKMCSHIIQSVLPIGGFHSAVLHLPLEYILSQEED